MLEPLFRAIDVEGGTVDRLRDLSRSRALGLCCRRNGESLALCRSRQADRPRAAPAGIECHLGPRARFANGCFPRRAHHQGRFERPGRRHCSMPGDFSRACPRQACSVAANTFPAWAAAQVDSHDSTPTIERSFASLWNDDLLPYRKLARELALVMVSHARYPLTASGGDPASVSHFWATEILGKKIGFRGLVVSDDMEMGGILSHTTLADATIRALLAGTHIIEICHEPARIFTAFEALLSEAERSPAFSRKLLGAARRVRAFKKEHLGADRLPAPPTAKRDRQSARRARALRRAGEQTRARKPPRKRQRNLPRDRKMSASPRRNRPAHSDASRRTR